MTPAPTPGQTIGPFFGFGLPYAGGPDLVPAGHPGAVRLAGRVLDGAGEPVPDALIEIWQADADGTPMARPGSLRRDGWTFTGFGRCPSAGTGQYSFTTVLPGAVAGTRAPFFAMTVFARGLTDRLFTRVYLPGYEDAWAHDPLLSSLSAQRRASMVATAVPDGLHFDVVLQGERETVFVRHRAAATDPTP